MMTFSFGNADILQQSFIPIFIISLLLTVVVGFVIYKSFGVNKWATLAGGMLMLIASLTFSSFNLSTIFYQLQLDKSHVTLSFAFPYQQDFTQAFSRYKYVDAITPDPNKDSCHVVLEDVDGMFYHSMDINVRDCERIQQHIATQLQLAPRPIKKSKFAPPPIPDRLK